MPSEKILLIEDEMDLQRIISGYLSKEGFTVICAENGKKGLLLATRENPTLILLDLMLPEIDGFEVCRSIRATSFVPIIILSAKNQDIDKMLSLGLGADDYVEKPFSLPELTARIKSHIRRYTSFSGLSSSPASKKIWGDVEIDSLSYKVSICGKEVSLTTREFQLLDYLSAHPSHVFTKEQLLDAVWGSSEYVDINTITVYVGRLREKMLEAGACYIKTVWGAGYKWEM